MWKRYIPPETGLKLQQMKQDARNLSGISLFFRQRTHDSSESLIPFFLYSAGMVLKFLNFQQSLPESFRFRIPPAPVSDSERSATGQCRRKRAPDGLRAASAGTEAPGHISASCAFRCSGKCQKRSEEEAGTPAAACQMHPGLTEPGRLRSSADSLCSTRGEVIVRRTAVTKRPQAVIPDISLHPEGCSGTWTCAACRKCPRAFSGCKSLFRFHLNSCFPGSFLPLLKSVPEILSRGNQTRLSLFFVVFF